MDGYREVEKWMDGSGWMEVERVGLGNPCSPGISDLITRQICTRNLPKPPCDPAAVRLTCASWHRMRICASCDGSEISYGTNADRASAVTRSGNAEPQRRSRGSPQPPLFDVHAQRLIAQHPLPLPASRRYLGFFVCRYMKMWRPGFSFFLRK